MTDFTDNYSFALPDFNFTTWHDFVNGNFEALDAILFSLTGFSNFVGAWSNATNYIEGQRVLDGDDGTIWQCLVDHTSAASDTFMNDRTANPTYWLEISSLPVIQGEWENDFAYSSGDVVYDSVEYLYGVANTSHTSSSSPNTMRDDIANWDIIADLKDGVEAATTLSIRTETDSAILELSDAFNIMEGDKATAMNITVPPNSDVAFPVSCYVTLSQIGAGQITVVPGSGVTIRSRLGLKLAGQYSVATLYKRGTNEWLITGDLTS